MRPVVLAAALACASCAPYVNGAVTTATTSAVTAATDPQSKQELDGLAASVVGAARDQALGPETRARLATLVQDLSAQVQALVRTLGAELRAELLATRDAALDRTLRAEVAGLREELLGAETRRLLAQLLADVVGSAAPLREQLVGAPLRQDADALLADIGARVDASVQAAVTKARADADAEVARYEWLLAAAGALLVGVLGASVLVIRSHRRVIDALVAARR